MLYEVITRLLARVGAAREPHQGFFLELAGARLARGLLHQLLELALSYNFV